MEDMKKEQLEVLNEAKGYCTNVLHCIDTVVPELKGDKKDDTDEYLRSRYFNSYRSDGKRSFDI